MAKCCYLLYIFPEPGTDRPIVKLNNAHTAAL